ncbi:MAG TPA: TIGR03790 family protein, partial [Candidatus Thermoplasmatota archaeon]
APGGAHPGGPWPLTVTLPSATFPLGDPFDYSDTVLLGNNNSQVSRNLTLYFQAERGVPDENVLLADLPVGETISEAAWNTFAAWWRNETANRSLGSQINYIVTFKGVPIRVSWTHPNGPGSFQDALMLLGGAFEGAIGNVGSAGYNNPYFNQTEPFSFARYGIRLVTGVYAYNESTAMSLIDRSAASLGSRGEYVLDTDASKGYAGGWGGYGYANQALIWANATLAARGEDTLLDLTNTYVTNRSGVMGYSSWGSNDCCWGAVTQNAKPHNGWVNGSIAETFVSTGGRTFTWPPSYGQSLIADWIDEGVTGIKGYTNEPYIHSIADGHILYGHYSQGYNLAESFWAASHVMGWRQIVVGDPKMAPYADVGDLAVNVSLTEAPPHVEQFGAFGLTLAVENTAAVARDVELRIELPGGSQPAFTLALSPSAVSQFTLSIDVSGVPPSLWGPQPFVLTVDPVNGWREWDEENNAATFTVDIRRPPVAVAELIPAEVETFDTAQLRLNATRADRPISQFVWREDGGPWQVVNATGNGASVAVLHNRSGLHTYEVYAVDAAGLLSTTVGGLTLTVRNRAPQAVASVSAPTPLSLEPVTLSAASSSDPDGVVASYLWDAGPAGSWATPTAEVAFGRPGRYTVNLTVTDDEGAQAHASVVVDVQNRPPEVVAVANASQAHSGVPFEVDARSSTDPDGGVVRYTFAFDGAPEVDGTEPLASHAFVSPGVAGVWVTVTDDWGATARARLTLLVLDRPPVVVWSIGADTTLVEGEALSVNVEVADPDSPLLSYAVVYGDGARADRPLAGSSATFTLSHLYFLEGEYVLRITVADVEGNLTAAQATVRVVHPAPQASAWSFAVVGENMTVSYVIDSPFPDLVSVVVYVDDVAWRTFPAPEGGERVLSLEGLAAGNHSLRFEVTDGVKTTVAASGAFEVMAAEPEPPPYTPAGPPKAGSPALLIPLILGGAVAVAATAALLVWRRRHPPEDAT